MSKTRTVDLPNGPDGESRTAVMTNLEWSLQYVILKIKEMVSDETELLQSRPPRLTSGLQDFSWTEDRAMRRDFVWH